MGFKFYKMTFWDRLIINGGCNFVFIMFLCGIWIDALRWKLIFTSIFLFIFILLHYAVLNDKDEKLRKKGYKNGN